MAHHPTRTTVAQELFEARARLTLADEVGLALRAHRRRLRLSQRAYAALRGYSRTTLGRLESSAGGHRLDDIVRALEGTGFALYLGRSPAPLRSDDAALGVPEPPTRAATLLPRAVPADGDPPAVRPEEWPGTELIARVRGGARRFPGHLEATRVSSPPRWWWVHEFFSGPSPEPLWYSPRPVALPDGTIWYPLAAQAPGASGRSGDADSAHRVERGPDDSRGKGRGGRGGSGPAHADERRADLRAEGTPSGSGEETGRVSDDGDALDAA